MLLLFLLFAEMVRCESRVLLGVLAEEAGVGELHEPCYLAYRQRRLAQVVLELRYRDVRYPFAGRTAAALLTDLRQVLRRDTQEAGMPLYLTLVRVLVQQAHELMERVVARIHRRTFIRIRDNSQFIQVIEHLHCSTTRDEVQYLLAVQRHMIL